MQRKLLTTLLLAILVNLPLTAQEFTTAQIKKQIEDFKKDPRGPYQRIRWFCDDGTMREPKDPCPDAVGGVQHASYKQVTEELAARNRLYFGEILAAAKKSFFWDDAHDQDRLKQYQLGKYLANVDDGWVLEKAQYYRGAIQSEDEQAWGIEFYEWLLSSDARLKEHYYLIRQSLRDIPHAGDGNLAQKVRSESKVLAEDFPEFMDLRVKIHGQPDQGDIKLVQDFKKKHAGELSQELKADFDQLIESMQEFYAPIDFNAVANQVKSIKSNPEIKTQLLDFATHTPQDTSPAEVIPQLSEMLCNIRMQVDQVSSPLDRLELLDVSIKLEDMLLRESQEWEPENLGGLLDKIYQLSYAAAGTGLLEVWEWDAVAPTLTPRNFADISVKELNQVLGTARNVVQWSASMAKATYDSTIERYEAFEPLADGFIDDRVRSSISLPLGKAVSELANFATEENDVENDVLGINDAGTIRGLNPGYALGELVVVEGNPEAVEVSSNKIYVFKRPPSDLKPVAGIATVDEGNLVSHVQLLARNLGIPNAAVTDEHLAKLAKYNGEKVFYAVSNSGTVIIKEADDMTPQEKKLFDETERSRKKIAVPIEQIRLDQKEILNMRDIDASASGKLAGPKAANLGQLKKMFPDEVVEGLVIPFGIFREHMDLPMPGEGKTYWEFLKETFTTAENMRQGGSEEPKVEEYQLGRLSKLREAIKNMQLKAGFVESLKSEFQSVFGKPMGETPVFLRSDTNMEDLKEFTGAGLNLTLFNVVDSNMILKGIKDVWASPYTERSFKWRQKYLSNPENVFPSILVIPSVDVDYSGVMITKGINEGTDEDLTVAFSRGAGGAVDGQAAETRLITPTEAKLLAPAREPDYIRLPTNGGVKNYSTTFQAPILNKQNVEQLRKIAQEIRTKIPKETGSDYHGAYDVELGFKDDKLYLFQIRPFVENKNALSSEYLESISPKRNETKFIELSTTL
ncbi:MAG: phosphoenolpyruvate synthase [Cytophagaceae bacterium]|nr:phosphoenolpyruvate synthase [Cytophagaceae bacterium]|tara:strand:- start:4182 stop:7088 length:2907 start_codon:yes stop_codon:yes gene_type:complete